MKQIKLIVLILSCLLMTSCDKDFLDRTPLSEVTTDAFFQKASDLQLYTNGFYRMLPGGGSIYSSDSRAANVIHISLSNEVLGNRVVPTTGGGWDWGYLRDINYFLQNYETVSDEAAKKHYSGVARFFRAYFYFDKLRRFGDVPWYEEPIEYHDIQNLEKSRDPRDMVAAKILEDLDYAIANLKVGQERYTITRYTALALKSRFGLYEGTYRKYRNLADYEIYLNATVTASEELIENSPYSVFSTGSPETDYLTLFTSHTAQVNEIILSREYNDALGVRHAANYYAVTTSDVRPGMPKEMVNYYLNDDGTRFTDQPNYNKIPFSKEVSDRDLRLSQTIRTPGYTRLGSTDRLAPNLGASMTGYQPIKYITEMAYDGNTRSINDLPILRFGEVLLNYAEAKAELGTLQQSDIDKSIKPLRDRINMPNLSLVNANANPDPYLLDQYPTIKGSNTGVILEIRRERRIELYMEGLRWDDIVRWKSGQLLTKPIRGMYFPGEGAYDLDKDGHVDVVLYTGTPPSPTQQDIQYIEIGSKLTLDENNLIDPHPTFNNRSFDENKDYLYPLPLVDLQLNTELTQNPGWED